mmetsp:Transcript_12381/g.18479  ORF Transcript_12381/g.18479 Transcript_12381/m.18479 type:complete len:492 (-) Transcript_12381:149-1624(-)
MEDRDELGAFQPNLVLPQLESLNATGIIKEDPKRVDGVKQENNLQPKQSQGKGSRGKILAGRRYRVKTACTNCKAAKARCDTNRPCGRCVKREFPHKCVDAVPKRRGRKRSHDHVYSRAKMMVERMGENQDIVRAQFNKTATFLQNSKYAGLAVSAKEMSLAADPSANTFFQHINMTEAVFNGSVHVPTATPATGNFESKTWDPKRAASAAWATFPMQTVAYAPTRFARASSDYIPLPRHAGTKFQQNIAQIQRTQHHFSSHSLVPHVVSLDTKVRKKYPSAPPTGHAYFQAKSEKARLMQLGGSGRPPIAQRVQLPPRISTPQPQPVHHMQQEMNDLGRYLTDDNNQYGESSTTNSTSSSTTSKIIHKKAHNLNNYLETLKTSNSALSINEQQIKDSQRSASKMVESRKSPPPFQSDLSNEDPIFSAIMSIDDDIDLDLKDTKVPDSPQFSHKPFLSHSEQSSSCLSENITLGGLYSSDYETDWWGGTEI